ncbi:toxin-antitoxin system HicB family antitoxin [Acetobacter ghanensis]
MIRTSIAAELQGVSLNQWAEAALNDAAGKALAG